MESARMSSACRKITFGGDAATLRLLIARTPKRENSDASVIDMETPNL
jgi:hypothetical protein